MWKKAASDADREDGGEKEQEGEGARGNKYSVPAELLDLHTPVSTERKGEGISNGHAWLFWVFFQYSKEGNCGGSGRIVCLTEWNIMAGKGGEG